MNIQSSREAHCSTSLSHHRTSDVAYGGLRFVFNKSRVHRKEINLLKVAQIESLVSSMGKRFSPPTRSRAGERPARTLRHAMCHKKSFDGVFPLALLYSVGAQTPAYPAIQMFHRLRKVSHFKVVEPTSRSLIKFSNNSVKFYTSASFGNK